MPAPSLDSARAQAAPANGPVNVGLSAFSGYESVARSLAIESRSMR
jgi:hypothetical protein